MTFLKENVKERCKILYVFRCTGGKRCEQLLKIVQNMKQSEKFGARKDLQFCIFCKFFFAFFLHFYEFLQCEISGGLVAYSHALIPNPHNNPPNQPKSSNKGTPISKSPQTLAYNKQGKQNSYLFLGVLMMFVSCDQHEFWTLVQNGSGVQEVDH